MKIGLVRHYKVLDRTTDRWMSSADFADWVAYYNRADIDLNRPAATDTRWDRCYSSDLVRATRTAADVFQGEPVVTGLLREIEICPLFDTTKIKLHLYLWLVLARLGWLCNHRSQESKTSTFERAKEMITTIERENRHSGSVLMVTHGAFMTVLRRELLRRGYAGERFAAPRNGQIYIYQKK